jgi:hypothetical protein
MQDREHAVAEVDSAPVSQPMDIRRRPQPVVVNYIIGAWDGVDQDFRRHTEILRPDAEFVDKGLKVQAARRWVLERFTGMRRAVIEFVCAAHMVEMRVSQHYDGISFEEPRQLSAQ